MSSASRVSHASNAALHALHAKAHAAKAPAGDDFADMLAAIDGASSQQDGAGADAEDGETDTAAAAAALQGTVKPQADAKTAGSKRDDGKTIDDKTAGDNAALVANDNALAAQQQAMLTPPVPQPAPAAPQPAPPAAPQDKGSDAIAAANDITAPHAPAAQPGQQVGPQTATQTGAQTGAAQPNAAQDDDADAVETAAAAQFTGKAGAKADTAKPDAAKKPADFKKILGDVKTAAPGTNAPAGTDAAPSDAKQADSGQSDSGPSDSKLADARSADPQASTPTPAAPQHNAMPQLDAVAASAPVQAATNTAPAAAAAHIAAAPMPQHTPNMHGLAVEIAVRSQSGAKQFDIRLDPPELGRVEVRLSIDATGKAQAHLTADQPDTLNLLKQDAPVLARALRDAGLNVNQDGLNFSLRSQQQQAEQQGRGSSRQSFTRATTSLPAIAAAAADQPSRRLGLLDIRV